MHVWCGVTIMSCPSSRSFRNMMVPGTVMFSDARLVWCDDHVVSQQS